MGRPNLIDWDNVALGTKPDKFLARELKVSQPAVRKQRVKRGIPVFKKLNTWDKSLLGKITDSEIARRYGLSKSTVGEQRIKRGINKAPYSPTKKERELRICVVCGEEVIRDRFRFPSNRTTCNLPKPCRNQLVVMERKPNWNNIRGQFNPHWAGGIMHSWGYVYIQKPEHHRAMSNGYTKRATIILEQKLGRLLFENEIAHHIDRNRSNDSSENLIPMDIKEHSILHLEDARETLNKRNN